VQQFALSVAASAPEAFFRAPTLLAKFPRAFLETPIPHAHEAKPPALSLLPGSEPRPMMQQAIVDSAYSVMPKGRQIVLYTYSLASPLPRDKLGLAGRRVGFVPANIPPASVWAYKQGHGG